MSDCTNGAMRDLLPELMHGTLSADTRRTVEAHVASCAECADELALLRALRPALSRGPVVNVERIAAAVRSRVPAGRGPARAPAWRTSPWRIAIAAAALLAVTGIGYTVITRHRSAPTVAVAPAPRAVTHDRDARAPAPAPATIVTPPLGTPPRAPTQLGAAPSQGAPTPPYADAGVLGNLADLSDADVRSLTASLDTLSALPDVEPGPVVDPLDAALDDQSGGRR